MLPVITRINNVLTPEECRHIIDLNKNRLEPAYLRNKVINTKVRRSKIAWIHPKDPQFKSIIDKCHYQMAKAALTHNVELKVFERSQFTQYKPFGFYKKHCDVGTKYGKRVISATIELSNPDDYYGGGISIQAGDTFRHYKSPQGTMIIFPSILTHQANTVWYGTRYSLVIWGVDHNTVGEKK